MNVMYKLIGCRLSVLLAMALGVGGLLSACATPGAEHPVYTSTATAHYDPLNRAEAGMTRRQALQVALRRARGQSVVRVGELRLSDGGTLGELAIVDPYVKAVIEDTARAAQVVDRTYSDEGVVSVTIRMELAPIYRMIENYPKHSIR